MKTYTETASAATSMTGRDDYVTLKAMLYAIATIQGLPDDERETSDLHDMQVLARATWLSMSQRDGLHDVPVLLCHAMLAVHQHTGQMPELWSNEFGDDPAETCEPRELALQNAVRATLAGMERDMAVFLAKFNRDHALGEAV